MIGPVGHGRFLARQYREIAFQEIAEAESGGIDIFAIPEDKIHRHVEHIFGIMFIAEAVFEHEWKHAGAVRIGVRPDMAAEALVAVGLALGEGRIGEQGGGQRLQGEADAEFLRHIGFAGIVEIDLDGAGAQHHVEAELADPRHVIEHDLVAALGHDRQFGAGLVRPHAHAKKTGAGLLAYCLHLLQMAAGFVAGFVQIFERRAG